MTKEIKNGVGGVLLCCLIILSMAVLTALLATSCAADMDDSQLTAQSKVVVFCFPNTASDTTQISVTRSIPISNKGGNKDNVNADGSLSVAGADVVFRLNGSPCTVKYAADAVGTVSKGMYYVVGKVHEGDEIAIDVNAPGLPPASARTTVPAPLPVSNLRLARITHNSTTYNQLLFDFSNKDMAGNYYAVTVDFAYHVKGNNHDGTPLEADRSGRISINIDDEPLLSGDNDDDVIFDFSSGFYDSFYIFNGNNVKSSTYTMRLNANVSFYNYDYDIDNPEYTNTRYIVRMYRIDASLYRFLKSLNDMQGNDLAQYGLAPILPTYSNMRGGIGILGGCSASEAEISFTYNQ